MIIFPNTADGKRADVSYLKSGRVWCMQVSQRCGGDLGCQNWGYQREAMMPPCPAGSQRLADFKTRLPGLSGRVGTNREEYLL